MGNGQYKEVKTPRYKTVYENKTYKEPVYRKEPVYDTKYYYNIDKWKETNALRTSADDHEPKWAETDLPEKVQSPKYGDKRQGSRRGKYWVIIKDDKGNEQKLERSLDEWKDLKEGDKVKVPFGTNNTLYDGEILRIDTHISSQVSPINPKHAKKIIKL